MTPDEANDAADVLKASTNAQIREAYDVLTDGQTQICEGDYIHSTNATGFVLSISRNTAIVLERSIYWPRGKEVRVSVHHLNAGLKCVLRKRIPR